MSPHGVGTWEPSLGARVRIPPRVELAARARAANPVPMPEPGQYAAAGRSARVVAVQIGPDGRELYRLCGLPGLWPAEYLLPDR